MCAVDCTRLISCAVICNYLHSHPTVLTTLIMTAKLNDVDPQAWLADVLARIAEQPASRLDDLLPWNWSASVRSTAPPQAA